MTSTTSSRAATYRTVRARIDALLEGETDWIAAMATVTCELNAAFDYFHWTGFYRRIGDELVIGPYQGGHGCLRIAMGKGVCGTAAATRETQLVPDVDVFPGHIACSSTTRTEIVVPVLTDSREVLAVLDVDSDERDAFDAVDQSNLESLCAMLGHRFGRLHAVGNGRSADNDD